MILIIAASFYVKLTLAALTMLLLAFAFALVLLVASIKLKVEVDPKVEQVHEALPNIDCGACGFAGCAYYAKAVVADAELLGKCAPGGSDVSNKIAQIPSFSGTNSTKRVSSRCHAMIAWAAAAGCRYPSCVTKTDQRAGCGEKKPCECIEYRKMRFTSWASMLTT